jgi:hypothetical protein
MVRPLSSLIEDLQQPALKALADHWTTLYEQRGAIPALHDVDPLCFPRVLKDVWIFSATRNGEFRVRLSGESFTEWYGFNPMGHTLSEVCSPEVLPVLRELAQQVTATPCVILQRMTSVMPGWFQAASFDRLGLPLADDDGVIRHLIGATVFDTRYFNGKGAASTRKLSETVYAIHPGVTDGYGTSAMTRPDIETNH